jgi:hypothetical protein
MIYVVSTYTRNKTFPLTSNFEQVFQFHLVRFPFSIRKCLAETLLKFHKKKMYHTKIMITMKMLNRVYDC